MLGLVLYVLIVLSTGSVILKLESTIYEFSLIFRVFVAFWKKLVSSSDTKVSSDRMFSSLSSRVILFANFLFSEKRVWMFFQKALLSVTLLTYDVSKLPFSCLFFEIAQPKFRRRIEVVLNVKQSWYNVGVQHWNNVDTTLCIVESTLFRGRTTSFQRCFNVDYNLISTFFQRGLDVFKPTIQVVRMLV